MTQPPQDPFGTPPAGPPPAGPPPGYGPQPGWDPAAASAPPGVGWAGGPQPGWGPPSGPPETSTKAIIALICAISAYLPIIPFVGAVAGVILARIAKREIHESGGRLTGEGLATAAFWVSVVHLVFVAVLVVLFAIAAVVFGAFGFAAV